MRRAWGATLAVVAMTMTTAGCGGGDGDNEADGSDESGSAKPAGAYDRDKYCELLKDAEGQQTPDRPTTEDRAGYMAFFDEAVTQVLAGTREIVAAAPADQRDNWQEIIDIQEQVVANAREFLKPATFEAFKAKSEDERLGQVFEVMLGPYAEADEAKIDAIGKHAKSECGIDLFEE